MKKIVVVAGILKYNEKFFCAQRNSKGPLAMKWEFPGGKIEINETQEEALIRELKEELTIDINIDKFFMTVKHQYETFHLTMHTYICHCKNIEDINLLVHLDSRWLKLDKLTDLDWAEADIPIIDRLLGE